MRSIDASQASQRRNLWTEVDDYMEDDDEKLYMDKLWLNLQVRARAQPPHAGPYP